MMNEPQLIEKLSRNIGQVQSSSYNSNNHNGASIPITQKASLFGNAMLQQNLMSSDNSLSDLDTSTTKHISFLSSNIAQGNPAQIARALRME